MLYYIPLLKESNKTAFFEVPYQLYKIQTEESIDQLYDYIKFPTTSSTLYHFDEYLCREYWLLLNRNGYTFSSFVEFKDELFKNDNLDKNQRMLFELTSLLHSFGEFSLAFSLTRDFLLYLETNPNTPAKVLAKTYNDVANECSNNGSHDKEHSNENFHAAFDYYNKAINLSKQHSLPELAVSYNGLALLCIKNDAAIQLAKMALKMNIGRFGEIHPEVAINYNTLANAYVIVEKYDESIDCYKKSIDILKSLYGETDQQLIVAYYNLSETLYECDHNEDALQYINMALSLIDKIYGDDYFDIDSYRKLKKSIETLVL